MNIETAVKFIPLGKAVLFTGAGFSSELIASDGDKVPSPGALSEIFAEKAGVSKTLPLDITSREYLKNATSERITEFVNLMQEKLTVAGYSDWHKKILNANWRSIYTTNYDNCAEIVESTIKIGIQPISKYSPYQFFDATIPMVHLHGYIKDLSQKNYEDALLLSRTQYTTYETNHPYWDFLQKISRRVLPFFSVDSVCLTCISKEY